MTLVPSPKVSSGEPSEQLVDVLSTWEHVPQLPQPVARLSSTGPRESDQSTRKWEDFGYWDSWIKWAFG